MKSLLWISLGIIIALSLSQVRQVVVVEREPERDEPPVRSPMPLNFSQLGFLTPDYGDNKIIPLFGRRLQRDRWQYYTVSNQHNDIKLPIRVGNRSALDSIGVNELSSGDRVMVHGYNEYFTVTLYDTDVQRYF